MEASINSSPITNPPSSTPSDALRSGMRARPRSLSPETSARIRAKNRRKRYLELHPEYFSPALELADPLAYDRLVRRFQTPAEREDEGRKKGYSGVLEADLWRSEAKVQALKESGQDGGGMSYKRGKDGEIIEEERDEVPLTKEEGMKRWKGEMERRFLRGGDVEFEYEFVDESQEFDGLEEERELEEKWFEAEEARWVEEADEGEAGRKMTGETGVQDF